MRLQYHVEAWQDATEIGAAELVRRLRDHFPLLTASQEEGNAHVQRRLDELIAMHAPDVILESHRSYFGNVIYVSISATNWNGARVVSYLYRMWPPLGDTVAFDVAGNPDQATIRLIADELTTALGMLLRNDSKT